MSKIAFLYPGQGAQVAGMGKDFYEQSPLAKEVFDKSCEILGQDMKPVSYTHLTKITRFVSLRFAMLISSNGLQIKKRAYLLILKSTWQHSRRNLFV